MTLDELKEQIMGLIDSETEDISSLDYCDFLNDLIGDLEDRRNAALQDK